MCLGRGDDPLVVEFVEGDDAPIEGSPDPREEARGVKHEELRALLRRWSAGEGPYDFNGVVHLLLACLDNLREFALDAELEDIGDSFDAEQAAFLVSVARRAGVAAARRRVTAPRRTAAPRLRRGGGRAMLAGMDFICAHDVIVAPDAAPRRSAFLLHGILGSRGNWRGFARALVEQHPDWRLVLVDLRGHGESQGAPGPHTVAACAADLDQLAESLGERPAAVVGHSFGGKVALAYARDFGRGLSAVWSLDSPPGKSDAGAAGGEVAQVIEAIRGAPMPVESRQVIVRYFEQAGFGKGIAGWMTTNLRRGAGGFRWVFELDVIDALLADYRANDLWPFVEAPPLSLAVHLLVATRGDRWAGADEARLAALDDARVHRLDAGHWVHIDDPAGLRAALGETFGAG